MTDAAERKFPEAAAEDNGISSDDPLFELSQILGFDDKPEDIAAKAQPDPQIDLEDALLAELGEMTDRAPSPEPQSAAAPVYGSDQTDFEPDFSDEAILDDLDAAFGDDLAADDLASDDLVADADLVAPETIEAHDAAADAAGDMEPVHDETGEVEAIDAATVAVDDELHAFADDVEFAAGSADEVMAEIEAPSLDADGFDDADDLEAELENVLADSEAVEGAMDFTSDVDWADEPVVAEPEQAAAPAQSLEDELEALLSGAGPIAAEAHEVPAEAVEVPVDVLPEFEPELEGDSAIEDDFAVIENDLDALDAAFATADEEIAAEEPAAQEAYRDPLEELESLVYGDRPAEAVPAEASGDEDLVLDDLEAALEEDFTSFFDDDEAFATDMLGNGAAAPEAVDALDDLPVLDTVDTDAFDDAPVAVDVPDLPEFTLDDTVRAAGDDAGNDDDAFSVTELAGAGLAAAAGAGAATMARAGAYAADDDTFDEGRFEAELARDMEFVVHDAQAESDHENLSLDDDMPVAGSVAAAPPQRRGMIVAAVLGIIAIVSAVAIFAFSGDTQVADGGPVLVEAGEDPVKVKAEEPATDGQSNQDRAVFDAAQGTVSAPEQEALNSSAEEPVDIAAVPDNSLPSDLGGGEKVEDRLVPGTETEAGATDDASGVVTPRRVRTLVVRPDGTLVERPVEEAPIADTAAVAAPEAAPAETVAESPVAAPAATDQAAPATGDVAFTPPASETPVPVAEASAPAAEAPQAVRPAQVPTRTVQTQTITPPIIADRPADQPVNVVNPQVVAAAPQRPAAEPAAAAQPAAPAPAAAAPVTSGSSGGYVVQLAALPSEAAAQDSATNLSQRYGNLIGGRGVSIQRAVVDGKGTFYRVRVSASDRGDATSLCERIKSSGGSCFVTR